MSVATICTSRRGSATVAVAALLIMVFTGPAVAQTDSSVQFLNDEPKVVELSDTSDEFTVTVVSSNPDPQATVQLTVVGKAADFLETSTEPTTAAPGAPVPLRVMVTPGAEPSEGQLVAIASDGSLARKDVTLSSPQAGKTMASPPTSLTLRGEQWSPFDRGSKVRSVRIQSDSGPVTGQVTGPNGSALVEVMGRRVSIPDGPRAGEYTGKIDLLPDAEGGEVTLTVQVRHLFIYPLGLLLVSLGVVGLLDRRYRVGRPRRQLEIRLTQIQEQARESHAAAVSRVRGLLPNLPADLLPRVSVDSAKSDLVLDAGRRDALLAWDAALEDGEYEQWKPPDGKALAAYRSYLDSYVKLIENADRLARAIAEYLKSIPDASRTIVEASGVFNQALGALRQQDVHNETELSEAAGRVEESFKAIALAHANYEWARDLLARASKDDKPKLKTLAQRVLQAHNIASLEQLKTELTTASTKQSGQAAARVKAGAALLEVNPEALRMLGRQPVSERSGATPVWLMEVQDSHSVRDWTEISERTVGPMRHADTFIVPATEELVEELLIEGAEPVGWEAVDSSDVELFLATDDSVLANVAAAPASLPPVPKAQPLPVGEPGSKELADQLRRYNVLYTVAASLLVLLSGMSVLYVGDFDFGATWGDYLKVILWGTAVGEGVELTRRFVVVPTT